MFSSPIRSANVSAWLGVGVNRHGECSCNGSGHATLVAVRDGTRFKRLQWLKRTDRPSANATTLSMCAPMACRCMSDCSRRDGRSLH